MLTEERYSKYPYQFLFLYALTYVGNASYNSFIPVYLDHIGFNKSIIGILLAIGPFIALISQPVWGTACDRAKIKNNTLEILLVGSAVLIILFPVSRNFYFIFFIMSLFTFFQSPINYITDAITLEYLETTRWKFGPIRMAGTVGFALVSILVGALAKIDINNIFIVYVIGMVLSFLVTLKIPRVKGHSVSKSRVQVWRLFKNRDLVMLLAMGLVFNITYGFLASFSPVYYKSMGANNSLIGIVMFISAMSEIPFLLFADKILDRLGVKIVLLLSSGVMAVRMLLLYMTHNVYLILPISLLHGLTFIVFVYSLATYINKEVPKELKATGQTINGFIGIGVARIIGNIAGGILSDKIGSRQVFFYVSLLELMTVIIFGSIFILIKIREG